MKTKIINILVLHPAGNPKQKEIFNILINKRTKYVAKYISNIKKKYQNCDILYNSYNPKTRTEYFKAASLLLIGENIEIEHDLSKVASAICNSLTKNGKLFCRTEKNGKIIIERVL